MRKYTVEEKEFLKSFIPGHSHKEITKAFNAKFEPITTEQVRGYIKNNRIKTGRTGQFEKGHTSANKGKPMPKAIYERCEQTMFKKGHTPHNHLEIGTEVLNPEGYWQVKIAEPNEWELKHRLVYAKFNGEIPKGYAVIFADRDRNNFTEENLILVSRAQLVRMNQNNLIKDNAEATRTGILIADLMAKTTGAKKKLKSGAK